MEGYLILGERARNPKDRQHIKKTIETTLKCKLDIEGYYQEYFEKHNLEEMFESLTKELSIPRLVSSR